MEHLIENFIFYAVRYSVFPEFSRFHRDPQTPEKAHSKNTGMFCIIFITAYFQYQS